MNRYLGIILSFVMLMACSGNKELKITVKNPLTIDRENEIIEITTKTVTSIKELFGNAFIVVDKQGKEILYQVTFDNKLLFPVNVKANETAQYTIKKGVPQPPETITCGKLYPERVDDIAWENDRIAFRTYGPALQATGERAFGYDVWTKRVFHPVVEMRYKKELDPETRKKIAEINKTDPKTARELANSISYHIDHGDGLDYYSVGPTLGCGTSALVHEDQIIYPYCYNSYKILDNGPLRFTVELTYNPLVIGDNTNVIETRMLSLDAGSQLNKIEIKYNNLDKKTPIATGLVMHEGSDMYQADNQKGYIAYADPADTMNGQIFVGAVIPQNQHKLVAAKPFYFTKEEKRERGNANGHILAISDYIPGSTYTYYFGAGWSKWGFPDSEAWFSYIRDYTEKINYPLDIKIK